MAPLATNVYTVRYDEAAPSETAVVRGDLTVTATDEQVEMTTSRFGVRLRLGGETFNPARAASEVPGPVSRKIGQLVGPTSCFRTGVRAGGIYLPV